MKKLILLNVILVLMILLVVSCGGVDQTVDTTPTSRQTNTEVIDHLTTFYFLGTVSENGAGVDIYMFYPNEDDTCFIVDGYNTESIFCK